MNSKYSYDIAVLGRCAQDFSIVLKEDFQNFKFYDDQRIELSDFWVSGGGPGANAAVAMARQGLRVVFIGRVGKDKLGNEIINELRAYGVDVVGIEQDHLIHSRVAIVLVSASTKERSFLSYGSTFPETLTSKQMEILDASNALHVDWYNPISILAAMEFSKRNQQVTFDAFTFSPELSTLSRLCTITCVSAAVVATILCPSSSSFSETGGDVQVELIRNNITKLSEFFGSQIIITLGSLGCFYINNNSFVHYQTRKPRKFVDTTGAGDIFNGILAASLFQGKNIQNSIKRALIAASLCCEGRGGREMVATPHEIDKLMSELS